MKEFKNLKFHSVIPQDILQAVKLLEKLGYEVWDGFSADDASKHNGICAWDDGEITEGWLDTYSGFEQVTLEDLKQMVGEDIKNDMFTLECLLGCEVFVNNDFGGFTAHIVDSVKWCNGLHVVSNKCSHVVDFVNLTFFTEDGDELTFDEYVNMYYGDGYVQS